MCGVAPAPCFIREGAGNTAGLALDLGIRVGVAFRHEDRDPPELAGPGLVDNLDPSPVQPVGD
eukprot:2834835-Alexandrium_andersonii.AAC.1